MKVSLRDFMNIVGESFFLTGLCTVEVETKDEDGDTCFEETSFSYDSGRTGEFVVSVSHLAPFLDYEVVRMEQKYLWGELDKQVLYLREMVKEKELDVPLDDKLADASIRSVNTHEAVIVDGEVGYDWADDCIGI